MPTFSPTDAALEGFRITRERPWAVAAWAGLYLVVGLVSALLMIATIGPEFAALQAAARANPADPAEAAALFEKLAPFYALVLPVALAFQSIMLCAVYRAVLKPDELIRGYIKVGRDELRMMLLCLAMALLAAGALFVLLFVDALVSVMLRSVAGGAGAFIAFLAVAVSLGAVVWVAVRLSLAAPMTFMTGELHIFRSWTLTRGQFWPLFQAYVLAGVLAFITLLLAMIVFWAIAGAVTMMAGGALADVGRVFDPDVTSIRVYFTPAMILYQLFGSALTAVFYTVVLAPPAVAYAALSQSAARQPAA
jgi:hypothetical protein